MAAKLLSTLMSTGVVGTLLTTLFLLGSTLSHASPAPDCHEFSAWFAAKQTLAMTDAQTSEQLEKLVHTEMDTRTASARTIFSEYLAGVPLGDRIDTCLSSQQDRGNYLFTLQSVFFDESLARLRAARGPTIHNLVAMLDQKIKAGMAPSFRLTGMGFSPDDPGPWDAGFHRGAGSIYADFKKIPPNEWLIIFAHELLHGLDGELQKAMHDYNNPEAVAQFNSWAKVQKDFAGLSDSQKTTMTAWIEAGLSRGLWAEYRAWVPSLMIYREGLNEQLWKPIDWLEQVLPSSSAPQTLDRSLYLYLDHGSPDPTDGLFAMPLFQSALGEIRSEYRNENITPGLGGLAVLVQSP